MSNMNKIRVPDTYEEFISYVLSIQSRTDPAFKTAQEVRDFYEKNCPGFENAYPGIRDHERSMHND